MILILGKKTWPKYLTYDILESRLKGMFGIETWIHNI